jgi:hypothetical protein
MDPSIPAVTEPAALSSAALPMLPAAPSERPSTREVDDDSGAFQREDHELDKAFSAMLARATGGISPAALSMAYLDWACHLAAAPQRQIEIAHNACGRSRNGRCILLIRSAALGT